MMRLFPLIAAIFLLPACGGLPKVQPAGGPAGARITQSCLDPFPGGRWQFVHSIEAKMPGGRSGFLTGVAVVSPLERSFRCAVLTLEGLSVFEAEWGPGLVVHRAVAPFDSRPFAEGLVEDLQLLFFPPPGSPSESGLLADGAALCRYRGPGGEAVDVVSRGGGRWEIRRYARDLSLARVASLAPGKKNHPQGIPGRIELTAYGAQSYKLVMELVEAVPIQERN